MLIAGYSGIGKSALVAEVHKPITKARGYFITGKFEQFQRNIPYTAVVQALTMLVRQLLTESEAQLQQWRRRLLNTLGNNGQVIIEVIPDVELIIGPQPPVLELGLNESQNRFHLVFQNFIRLFCSPQHPLVIFLDDLQWADSASLKLLELMLEDSDTHNLFIIGAYRDNEVDPYHPLTLTLEELGKAGVNMEKITLQPLESSSIRQLLVDTLNSNHNNVEPLAELVIKKTGGNPFFTNEFLKTLYEENFLTFNPDTRHWQWQLEELETINITDNVVDLMVSKLQKLPANTQHNLQLAACIGAEFDLHSLVVIAEQTPQTIFDQLKAALNAELVFSVSDLNEQLLIQDYKFGHDRIQQAAYNSIDEGEKQTLHLQIGRLLLQQTPPDKLGEKVFAIVDHFNLGLSLGNSSSLALELQEKQIISELNLKAGRKAIAATAYQAAIRYLQAGIDLLSADCWKTQYELTLKLYSLAVEANYLAGDFIKKRQLADVVIERAKTPLDKVKVYEIRIQAYAARNEQREAVQTARSVLELFGVSFPATPNPEDIQHNLQETLTNLADKKVEDLSKLPPMNDAETLAVMGLITSVLSSSYIAAPTLLPLLVFKQVNLSLQFGNTPLSAIAYAYFGLLLCGIVGDVEKGYQFGQLALQLIEQFQAKEHQAKVLVVLHATISIWSKPVRESIKPFQTAYQVGLETGDFEYAGNCSYLTALHSLFSGKNLKRLEPKVSAYSDAVVKIKQTTYSRYNRLYHQAILNLLGQANNPRELKGEAYQEEDMLPVHIEGNDRYGVFCFSMNKVHLLYLFQDYHQALENLARAEEYLDGGTATLLMHLFYFYDSLTRLTIYSDASSEEQQNILERVNTNQEKMQNWAKSAPMNYLHKYQLVEAEKYRVTGAKYEAMEHYDSAIKLAQENKFLNDEALANELAARFYLGQDKEKFAQVHLQEAFYCYGRWGATAKLEDLETRYPQLLNKSPTTTNKLTTTSPSTTTRTSSSLALDLATVIKASQAIGGEIVLEQLLQKLMTILIANAGAQTGFLLLETEGELLIEAEGAVDEENVTVLQSLPLEEHLPNSIINYVVRTFESVVLHNAHSEGQFTQDSYLQKQQTKSVLCLPLINQGQLVSILYLENNLTTGAFTPDRLEILQILSSQAAISIENARLYQTLEDRVASRTAQLAQANEEIVALNEKLKEENLRLGAELDIAKQLQQMVLPKQEELESVPGLEIAGYMEPADEVGGDYYDVLPYEGGVKIGIGDVTGHGLESGVLMIMAQTAVRTLQRAKETDPVKFLDAINQTLYENLQRIDSYKNMTLAVADYANGTLKLSGQHEEMILVRANGELECIDTMNLGFPIGLDSEIADFIAQDTFQLEPGDVVVLYTDGITEAENHKREQYGLERLCQVIQNNYQKSAEEIKQAVVAEVHQFIQEQKVFDDITLVVLKQKD